MVKMLEWLKNTFPFLWSPRFWGVVATATFTLFRTKGWFDDDWAAWIQAISGGATVVGVVGWVSDKMKRMN